MLEVLIMTGVTLMGAAAVYAVMVLFLACVSYIQVRCAEANGGIGFSPLSRAATRQELPRPSPVTLDGDWKEAIRRQYPEVCRDEPETVAGQTAKGAVVGRERYYASVKDFIVQGDVVIVRYVQIDNWTELWGMREVYSDHYQVAVDLWTRSGDVVTPQRIHAHADNVVADNLSMNWSGTERRNVSDCRIEGLEVHFNFDGREFVTIVG